MPEQFGRGRFYESQLGAGRYAPVLPRQRLPLCADTSAGPSLAQFQSRSVARVICAPNSEQGRATSPVARHTPIITTADCEGAGEMFEVASQAGGGGGSSFVRARIALGTFDCCSTTGGAFAAHCFDEPNLSL